MEGDVQTLWALAPQGPLPHFLKIVSHNRLRRWRGRKMSPSFAPQMVLGRGKLRHSAISTEWLEDSFFLRPRNVLVPRLSHSPGGAQKGRPCLGFSPYNHGFAPTLGQAPIGPLGTAWTCQTNPWRGRQVLEMPRPRGRLGTGASCARCLGSVCRHGHCTLGWW